MAPVLVRAKVLLQDLWLLGADWDAPVPDRVLDQWHRFRSSLPQLEDIAVPRWLGTTPSSTALELHAFCDASERAYCCAVYLRVPARDGTARTSLLIAKTKVAPVRSLSIPRLELNGALLLVRLVGQLTAGLHSPSGSVFAWTDSAVVLAWLAGHASRWKPFVAHRVAEIQSSLPPSCWRHVGTACNPADLATRGLTPGQLADSRLWWEGPSWLSQEKTAWPQAQADSNGRELEEQRQSAVCVATVLEEDDSLLHRYSDLSRLQRITALCRRFLHNARNPAERTTGPLTTAELRHGLLVWVRRAQATDFATELELLRRNRTIPAGSPLRALAPFVCPEGLLRVGGRLQGSYLSYGEKHPVILDRRNTLTLLLVRDAHLRTLHGGPSLTRSYLLRGYWILRGTMLTRKVIHDCVRCARFRGAGRPPFMGQLPAARVRPSRPFLSTGVDFAGPIPLRTWKGRGYRSSKGYISLFICLATKAIHLEVVSDLTSQSFIAAFRRFVSRRGRCSRLLSDNATNFKGADAELHTMFREATDFYALVSAQLAKDGTDWSFIPPHAPHFGGLWEAGVKSVKHHLRRVIGDQTLTYEEMTTLLCQVEACLNSRPLCPLSEDPSDLAALTPGHLLVGEPLTAVPEPASDIEDVGLLPRWRRITHMRDHFWRAGRRSTSTTSRPGRSGQGPHLTSEWEPWPS